MWSFSAVPLLVFLGSTIFHAFSVVSASSLTTATFTNSIRYKFDTAGNAIDSTSGKIDFLNGTYVWYGLTNGCGGTFCGIASWSSPDLQTWTSNGFLFDPTTTEIQDLCTPDLSGNCGRPHIIYNSETKTYVLWVNAGTPGYVIFTSTNPTSGYIRNPNRALVGFQPPGPFSGGDFTVAVIEGKGYIVYSLIDFSTAGSSIWPPFNQSLYLQSLDSSLQNTTGSTTHILSPKSDLVDWEAESPDIFKRGEYFYITASNTCGFCTGTLLIVYRSKTIEGPWIRQIISGDTCGGQTTGVLTLPNPNPNTSTNKSSESSSYLHQADLFSTAPITGTRTAAHGHQFQPLSFLPDGSVQNLNCTPSKSVTIPIILGSSPSPSSPPLTTTYGSDFSSSSGPSPPTPYTPTCPLPSYQLYQTFSSSKPGALKEIGINVASVAPTGNLTITIFRYTNNTNFYTPHYIWETLSALSIPPSSPLLSQSFAVVRVPVNATVAAGDKLGIALVSASITPFCFLVKGLGRDSRMGEGMEMEMEMEMGVIPSGDRNLFAIGVNQVSLRGPNGMTPPVMVLRGEIKWSAVVE